MKLQLQKPGDNLKSRYLGIGISNVLAMWLAFWAIIFLELLALVANCGVEFLPEAQNMINIMKVLRFCQMFLVY